VTPTHPDAPKTRLVERVVLYKFDGDLTDEEMETTEPAEAIVRVDGVIVERWQKGDSRPCPKREI
jgi:hypothetical protein